MNTLFKKISIVLLAGFLFVNFAPTILVAQAAPEDCYDLNDTDCKANEDCLLHEIKIIFGLMNSTECVPSNEFTRGVVAEEKAEAEKVANVITGLDCPTGSYRYTEDNTSWLGQARTAIYGFNFEGDQTKIIACMEKGNLKDANDVLICNASNAQKYYKGNDLIGCIVPPTKVTRQGDIQQTDLSALRAGTFEYKVKVIIPCNDKIAGGKCPVADNPAGFVGRLYQFGLMIAGIAALGMIIFGALKYTLSAGNIGSKEDARDQMLQAIYGLVLLFGAYLILYTINPDLVTLKNPQLEIINLDTLAPGATYMEDNNSPITTKTPDATPIIGCLSASGGGGLSVAGYNTGLTTGVTITGDGGTQTYSATPKTKCTECATEYGAPRNGMCCIPSVTDKCITCNDVIGKKDTDLMTLYGQNQAQDIMGICNL